MNPVHRIGVAGTRGSFLVGWGVLTEAEGDQSGNLAALCDKAKQMGFRLLVNGKLSNHVTCLLEVMDEALADASQAAGIRRTDGNSMED